MVPSRILFKIGSVGWGYCYWKRVRGHPVIFKWSPQASTLFCLQSFFGYVSNTPKNQLLKWSDLDWKSTFLDYTIPDLQVDSNTIVLCKKIIKSAESSRQPIKMQRPLCSSFVNIDTSTFFLNFVKWSERDFFEVSN